MQQGSATTEATWSGMGLLVSQGHRQTSWKGGGWSVLICHNIPQLSIDMLIMNQDTSNQLFVVHSTFPSYKEIRTDQPFGLVINWFHKAET